MSDLLCVTNRNLVKENFLTRIEKIAKAHPAGIILREKDLEETVYRNLAQEVMAICKENSVPCILHSFIEVAIALKSKAIHMPIPLLLQMKEEDKKNFSVIGASCHSVEDAVIAQKHGCTYITAGHIFPTQCKEGLPGRGLVFFKSICDRVSIPVYAIGGIHPGNITEVEKNGGAGGCVMRGAMECEDVKKYFLAFKEKKNEI